MNKMLKDTRSLIEDFLADELVTTESGKDAHERIIHGWTGLRHQSDAELMRQLHSLINPAENNSDASMLWNRAAREMILGSVSFDD